MKLCLVDRCWRPHKANGYCRMHYDRVKKYGNPHHSSITPTNNGKPIDDIFIADLKKTLQEVR